MRTLGTLHEQAAASGVHLGAVAVLLVRHCHHLCACTLQPAGCVAYTERAYLSTVHGMLGPMRALRIERFAHTWFCCYTVRRDGKHVAQW
jgi:hypothetical protein